MDGVCGGTECAYTFVGVVDGGEDVLTLPGQRDNLDEAHCQDRLILRAREVDPYNGWLARAGLTPAA